MRAVLVNAGDCPYLPGRRFHALTTADARPEDYRALIEIGFRRAGERFYLPRCPDCQACHALRVPVADFRPRRDQRRCIRRNADLTVGWAEPGMDAERSDLYRRYQAAVHDQAESEPEAVADHGGVPGGELHARDAAGRLLAVSVVDLFADAMSSVYCYWEPAAAERGLGIFLALAELSEARRLGLRWWYPGLGVTGCAKMAYKERFQPFEAFIDGHWAEGERD
jgi:arginyl-tRNA--protein-N-Asp/Glu arginylyltransferase